MKIYRLVSKLNEIMEKGGMDIDVEFVEYVDVVGGKPIANRYNINSIDFYHKKKKVELS